LVSFRKRKRPAESKQLVRKKGNRLVRQKSARPVCLCGEIRYGTRTLAALNGVGVEVVPAGGPKYSAVIETVWPVVRLFELATPSKFVLVAPLDNCTLMGVVRAKNGGNVCIVKTLGGATLATVPVTRVNRR